MKILALDIATKTGWASNYPLGRVTSGVDSFARGRGDCHGSQYIRFAGWLREKIMIIEPISIYYEMPHHRGGAATMFAYEMSGHMKSVCTEFGVKYIGVATGELKKHATGRGNAKKPEMIKACIDRLGIDPADDNEADACWLLDYGLHELTGKGVKS